MPDVRSLIERSLIERSLIERFFSTEGRLYVGDDIPCSKRDKALSVHAAALEPGEALLVLYDHIGWAGVFGSMSMLLLLASVPIALHAEGTSAPAEAHDGVSIFEVLRRPGMGPWMAVLVAYKFGEALAGAMLRPMLVDLGLSMADIGWLLGTAGFAAGLVGAVLGGWAAGRWGRRETLVLAGVLQAVTVGAYLLPAVGIATAWVPLALLVTAEHLIGGVATAALFTAMMDRCDPDSGGTDYTLQASAVVISTGTAAALSGLLAEPLGYATHFAIGGGLSLAGTALLVLLWPKR